MRLRHWSRLAGRRGSNFRCDLCLGRAVASAIYDLHATESGPSRRLSVCLTGLSRLPVAVQHALDETAALVQLCTGLVDADAARDLIVSSIAWCVGQLRASTSDRAAFSRPTVGPRLAERPQAVGGRANYASLERSRARLLSRLHVIECDISKLPSRVGMLVVPSNEMLADPGFGAMHAIYEQGGAALRSWVHTYRQARASALRAESAEAAGGDGTPLAPGDAVASPAFGSIQAEWLCHAVGISFYDPNQFQRVVLSTEPSSADQTAHAAERAATRRGRAAWAHPEHLPRGARAGVTSLAMPAVSSGKRKFLRC